MNQNEKALAALKLADKLIRFEDNDPQWVRMQRALEAIQEAKSALESQPIAVQVREDVDRTGIDLAMIEFLDENPNLVGIDKILKYINLRTQTQAPAVEVPTYGKCDLCDEQGVIAVGWDRFLCEKHRDEFKQWLASHAGAHS